MRAKLIIVGGVVAGLVGSMMWFGNRLVQRSGTHKFDEPREIASAAILYREAYGSFPSGSYTEICLALSGKNPRELTFVGSPDRIGTDERGGFLDAWNRPYTIFFSSSAVLVRSRGADGLVDDGQFYGADDVLVSKSIDDTENTWYGRPDDG